jgi:hypothetical protein
MYLRMRMLKSGLYVLLGLSAGLARGRADPVIEVITGSLQIGEMDLATGAFTPAASIPSTIQYLAPGPGGSLLTMDFGGDLDSINRTTGATTAIGPTGFSFCSGPASCGTQSQLSFGGAGGTLYATDFANNLYTVNPTTGKATLVGPTGIPALTSNPLSANPDGTLNFYDENLFGAGGKLYANFDTGVLDPTTFTPTPVTSATVYQIDPTTGHATAVGATAFGMVTVAEINGVIYGFEGPTNAIVTLNVANGATTFVSNYDPAVGLVEGAAATATPEPSCLILGGIGIAALIVFRTKRAVAADKRSE